MTLKKGKQFLNHLGEKCFISYLRADVVKLTYVGSDRGIEVWSKEDFLKEISIKRFTELPDVKVNRENIAEHLIEYQLNMVGKTIEEARKNDNWYHEWTFTEKQFEVFKGYAIPLMRKVLKLNKAAAEKNFAWFDLTYGLRIKKQENGAH